MKKRSLFKGIIAVLFLFLCVEVGVVMYQINSGTNAFPVFDSKNAEEPLN